MLTHAPTSSLQVFALLPSAARDTLVRPAQISPGEFRGSGSISEVIDNADRLDQLVVTGLTYRFPESVRGVEDVSLTAHPLPDDPNAPTVRVVLYRDPTAPNQYHYLLSKSQAKHLRRAGGTPFVYPTWEEFAHVHPSVAAAAVG